MRRQTEGHTRLNGPFGEQTQESAHLAGRVRRSRTTCENTCGACVWIDSQSIGLGIIVFGWLGDHFSRQCERVVARVCVNGIEGRTKGPAMTAKRPNKSRTCKSTELICSSDGVCQLDNNGGGGCNDRITGGCPDFDEMPADFCQSWAFPGSCR